MRVRRTLLSLAGTALVLAASASTAAAGNNEPEFDISYNCDGGAIVAVGVNSVTDEEYDLLIGDAVWTNVANEEVSAGPYDNGFVTVEVFEAGTTNEVYSEQVPVGCGEPFVAIDSSCDDGDGAHIFITISDDEGWDYDVYVDDLNDPLDGWQEITDTDLGWDDLGVFPEGEHTVSVVWYQNQTEEYYFQQTIDLSCDDDGGSGAGLPDSGSESTTLMLIAAGLVAVGAGLMVARRARLA